MEFNARQLEAINGTEKNKLIVAPAGSGKTSTLIGAIKDYHKKHPIHSIAAITFTRKAAGELKERVSSIGDIEVSTIHSWSWRELQKLANEYNFKVQLLEEEVIKDILKKLCRLRRQFYLNQFQLYNYIMGNYNIDVDDSIKKIFMTIHADYINFKKKNNLYDFTDLPEYLLDKLNEYSETITNIDAFFVDEFQDIDPIQYELFEKVESDTKFYIGDPAQAIYGFRGAISRIFNKLDNFTEYQLNINYRSYQEIIDYATNLRELGLAKIPDHDIILPSEAELGESNIECIRGTGGTVCIIPQIGECINLVTKNMQSDVLVIKQLMADKKTQILCRSNKQVKKLKALQIDNVSTIHQAKGLEYDNVILVDFPCDCEEELNVAYVGATRAKNTLCVIEFEVLLYIICREDIKSNNKLF